MLDIPGRPARAPAAGAGLLARLSPKSWIGLTDAGTEGVFAWADGTPVPFTQGKAGEPGSTGEEDGAEILGPEVAGSATGGGWIGASGTATRPFGCELPSLVTCGAGPPSPLDAPAGEDAGPAAALLGAAVLRRRKRR